MSREENETRWKRRGGRERGKGGTVSGSVCKKEQVSIYTASPRIKDPAEYVGKSRRVLVLLFLFATSYFLSLSLFLLFQLFFSRYVSPLYEGPPPKIGKWAVGIRRARARGRSRRSIFLHPAYTFNVRQPFWADILRWCLVPDRPSPMSAIHFTPFSSYFTLHRVLFLKLFPRKLINERDRFWALR